MVFSDLFFLFVFLPLFLLCYVLGHGLDRMLSGARQGSEQQASGQQGSVQQLPVGSRAGVEVKNGVLVVFSLLFYAWGEPVYVFLMVLSVWMNYLTGLGIAANEGGRRKAWLVFGLVWNVLAIGVFKYAGFFCQVLQDVGLPVVVPRIALPIGISFYTFQCISYLVDVYRGTSPEQRRFDRLLLYISMFPQLIAGPIVRYQTVADEIGCRRVTLGDFSEGMYRFFLGLGKKVIIANQLGEVATLLLDQNHAVLSASGAWLGIGAYALQIYFDFSGYSDMAIGLGRCMGFHFMENFNHPYISQTITEFWRRWHMSLGTFFRDYVYIPLGGNRRHQVVNILVVWMLTGMWHGASWNFILWGLYFGLIVMLEKYTILKVQRFIPRLLRHVYALLLIVVGWGIFYFDDFSRMEHFFLSAFGGNPKSGGDFLALTTLESYGWIFVVAVVLSMPVRQTVARWVCRATRGEQGWWPVVQTAARVVLTLTSLVVSTALLVGATNNAFIYTRF